MQVTTLAHGEQVVVGDRVAVFLELNASGSPIVRFAGKQGTRVVPMDKVRPITRAAPVATAR